MCENNVEGSLGIIINKPMQPENVSEILQKTGLEKITPSLEIYFGGPVNIEMGLILHDASYEIEGTLIVSENLALTSNKRIVSDLQKGSGPTQFRFSLGYAGWDKGQLEKEIENGDWLLLPADEEIVFSIPDAQKWQKAVDKLGFDINNLGGSTGFA